MARADLTMRDSRMAVAYLKVGDGIIALDGAVDPGGFIAKFIERRGEGLHHIGMATPRPRKTASHGCGDSFSPAAADGPAIPNMSAKERPARYLVIA